jgi:hypothetical protein
VTSGYFNAPAGVLCAPQIVGTAAGYGSFGLGGILGPGQNNWDMTVSKTFRIREAQTLQFRTEFFNTFNHPQFNNPFANVALGNFGTFNGTSVNPRLIQFALKYLF